MSTFTFADLYGGGGSSLFSNEQRFTTSGTFTVPDGVYRIFVTGVGGGGGGASGGLSTSWGRAQKGGGAGAWCYMLPLLVTPGETINAVIGAGGAGGAALTGRNNAARTGVAGGHTQFGSITLHGGGGGGAANAGTLALPNFLEAIQQAGTGALGGNASNDIRFGPGYAGTNNHVYSGGLAGAVFHNTAAGSSGNVYCGGGGGGAGSIFGAGGNGTDGKKDANTANGLNATGYGAGGGSAGSVGYTTTNRTAGKGGNGSPGIIIVNW